jgi:glycosyltransferase involved in cell wall biosynthesis
MFLSARGFNIERLSLEENNWQERLQRDLDESRYALVHGFHALHFGQVIQIIPQIRKLPMLLTTTGTDINYDLLGKKQHIVLEAMQAVDRIVVFNEDFHRDLSVRHPEFSDKLITIPQGVFLESSPLKTRAELGLSPDDIIFLLPSGLRPVKNTVFAINALARVHQEYPELQLLIIGAAIEEHYCHRITDLIKGLDWVTYLGEIPHAQMQSILAMGDVVINTSNSEGQPQGALEAMSLGKPCILTAVPGNLNIINHGIEGFYVDSEADLISTAKTLIKDTAFRKALGKNAQQLVEARFGLEREIDAYSQLYNGYF